MEHADLNAVSNAVEWLEEEHRQHKASVFKLQQLIEQVQASLWTLGDRVNTVEGAINTVAGQGARVARVEEDTRQAREQLERLEGRIDGVREVLTREERVRTADAERERLERTELAQRMDAIERAQSAHLDRIQAAEEVARRRQEEMFGFNHGLDQAREADEKLASQIISQQAQLKHQLQAIEDVQHAVRSLQSQDEVFQGRVQHLGEQMRRLESQEELRVVEARLVQALSEQGELHKVERLRMERSIVEVQMAFEQYRSNADDLHQEMIHLQGRIQSMTDHLDHVRESLWELRNEIVEHFTAIAGMEEQRRRRQLTEMEQQLKELAAWKPKPPRS